MKKKKHSLTSTQVIFFPVFTKEKKNLRKKCTVEKSWIFFHEHFFSRTIILFIFLRIKCSVKQKCKYKKKIHEKNNLCETGYKKFPKKILGEK